MKKEDEMESTVLHDVVTSLRTVKERPENRGADSECGCNGTYE